MLRTMCKGKIHRARVTEARLDYTGSTTIDRDLMRAADISPYEPVRINNRANAANGKSMPFPMIPVSFA